MKAQTVQHPAVQQNSAHPSLHRNERAPRVIRSATVVPLRPEEGGHRQRFGQHVHLFREGDDAVRIYELIDGAVMLYKLLPDGRRQVVELIGPGDVFGISAIPVHECSAETLVAGQAVVYDRAVVDRSPDLFRRLSAHLQAQFCAMHEHAVLLGRKSALERVASFVMRCVPGRGGYGCPGPRGGDNSINVRLGMTRQEIADYLGLTIETVSRAFSELRRRGVVTIDKQEQVRVNDICRMCKLTGAH
jgi:CRP/FNR family transcriptional regulator